MVHGSFIKVTVQKRFSATDRCFCNSVKIMSNIPKV